MDLPSLPLSIATVVAGIACLSLSGSVLPLHALICILFGLFVQVAANLYHRFCDEKYSYGENARDGLENVKVENFNLQQMLKEFTTAIFLIALLIGGALIVSAPSYTIVAILLLFFSIILYSNGHKPLSRYPIGILIPFLTFGPIGVMTTNLVQLNQVIPTQASAPFLIFPSLWVGVALGLFAVNYKLFVNYADYSKSKADGNRNFVNTIGRKSTIVAFMVSSVLIFVVSILFSIAYHFPYLLVALIPLSLITLINFIFAGVMYSRDDKTIRRARIFVALNALLYAVCTLIQFTIWGIPTHEYFDYF